MKRRRWPDPQTGTIIVADEPEPWDQGEYHYDPVPTLDPEAQGDAYVGGQLTNIGFNIIARRGRGLARWELDVLRTALRTAFTEHAAEQMDPIDAEIWLDRMTLSLDDAAAKRGCTRKTIQRQEARIVPIAEAIWREWPYADGDFPWRRRPRQMSTSPESAPTSRGTAAVPDAGAASTNGTAQSPHGRRMPERPMSTHDEPKDLTFDRDDEGSIEHIGGDIDIDLAAGPIEDVVEMAQLVDQLYAIGERSDAWTMLIGIQRRWLAFTKELERAVGLAYARGLADQGKPPMKTTVIRGEDGQPIGTVAVPISPEEAARLEAGGGDQQAD